MSNELTVKDEIDETAVGRWHKVKAAIGQARDEMKIDLDKQTAKDGWRNTAVLRDVLGHLDAFVEEGVTWLNKRNNEPPNEDVRNRYPAQYARNLIVRQAAHDLRAIWHVFKQRQVDAGGQGVTGESFTNKDTVEFTEHLAQAALQPALAAGLFTAPPALMIYFQKSPSIRVIPYANTAFIALPYWLKDIKPGESRESHPRLMNDLLALPHEVGHFVYWRGKTEYRIAAVSNDGTAVTTTHGPATIARLVKHKLQNMKSDGIKPTAEILKRWSEEIFADVYGFKFEAASAASMLDILLDQYWREEMHDLNDEHPAPMLRPESLLTIIRRKDTPYNPATGSALNQYWHGKDIVQSVKGDIKASVEIFDHLREGYRLRDDVAKLAEWMYDLLQSPSQNGLAISMSKNGIEAMQSVGDGQQVHDTLLENWRERVTTEAYKLHAQSSLKLTPSEHEAALHQESSSDTQTAESAPSLWTQWQDELLDEYKQLELTQKDWRDEQNLRWIVSISAGGWTDGPANGGNRPV